MREGGKDVGGVHCKVALQAPGDACRQDCEKTGECCQATSVKLGKFSHLASFAKNIKMFDSFFCLPKTAEFSNSHLPDAEGLRVFSGARQSSTTGVAFSAPAAAVVSFFIAKKYPAVFKKITSSI